LALNQLNCISRLNAHLLEFQMPESNKKIAMITGASSGLGAVYADRLARRGYDLILVARRAERLHALAETIAATHGRQVEVIAADLEKEADLARVEAALSNPDLHMLVNNAGLARFSSIAAGSVQDSLSQIALNITALTRLTHAVLPGFAQRNRGVLINVGSVLGIHAMPTSSVYSGTKGFVLNFTRGLQKEFADTGVRVQLVAPASTATEVWDNSGIPLAALNPDSVMTTENCVDAALAGLDAGEDVTWPSVPDHALWDTFDDARAELFASSQTGKPAPRYAII
jgi:short-subunit dehydrogenase